MASTELPISEGNTWADVELLVNSADKLMRSGKLMRCSEPSQKRSFLRPLESACPVTKFVEDRHTFKL